MKVKMLVNCGGLVGNFVAGQEYEVPKDIAEDFLRAGYAEACGGRITKVETAVMPDVEKAVKRGRPKKKAE